jgi:hypothetical protein
MFPDPVKAASNDVPVDSCISVDIKQEIVLHGRVTQQQGLDGPVGITIRTDCTIQQNQLDPIRDLAPVQRVGTDRLNLLRSRERSAALPATWHGIFPRPPRMCKPFFAISSL